jgi:hypothetical protein
MDFFDGSNGPADRGRYAVEIWLLVIAFKRLGVAWRSGERTQRQISAVFGHEKW